MTESKLNNQALFIDFENFGDRPSFDAKQLINGLKSRGRLVVKRAYADWGRYANYKHALMASGVELIEMPSHKDKGKNSADIKLTVDALETAITKPYIDTMVILSGDSDYMPLIAKLHEYNKYVIVIGVQNQVSKLLSSCCDELIYYDNLIGRTDPTMGANRPTPLSSKLKGFALAQSQTAHCTGLQRAEHRGYVAPVTTSNHLIAAEHNSDSNRRINSTLADDDNKMALYALVYHSLTLLASLPDRSSRSSRLGAIIRQLDPTFSLPKYGYAKTRGFKQIFQTMSVENLVTCEFDTEINDYIVCMTDQLRHLTAAIPVPPTYAAVRLTMLLAALSLLIDANTIRVVLHTIDQLQATTQQALSVADLMEHFAQQPASAPCLGNKLTRSIGLMLAAQALTLVPATSGAADELIVITGTDTFENSWRKLVDYIIKSVADQTGEKLDRVAIELLLNETTAGVT